MKTTKTFLLTTSLFFSVTFAKAQESSFALLLRSQESTFSLPEESQKAITTQRIGVTDISIIYHSPSVKGRKIWGDLVPYQQVWRAGANENTIISFKDDIRVNGNLLPAGAYGIHMIPDQSEWIVIFSKNYKSWGSFFYKKEEDILRVTVKPIESGFQEWLSYEFTDRQAKSSVVLLAWEKLRVPFKIEVDVDNIVLANYKDQFRGLKAFTWQLWYDAATYCLENNINYEEALKWIDRSIKNGENSNNLQVKAGLLSKTGQTKEGDEIMKKVLITATEDQINLYGYKLLKENKVPQAIEIFAMNIKKNPNSWNAYDSMAEACLKGDNKRALANYKIALAKAPEEQKPRILESIKKLSENK